MRRCDSSLLTRAVAFLAAVALLAAPDSAQAQALPFSLEDIVALVNAGSSSQRILAEAGGACISFRVDESAERQLRGVGADDELLEGLRSVCVILPGAPAEEVPAEALPAEMEPTLTVTRGSPAGLAAAAGLAAGTAAAGALMKRTRIECAMHPPDGQCPSNAVLSTRQERPLLLPALLAAAAIGAGGYMLFRTREVELPSRQGAAPGAGASLEVFSLAVGRTRVHLDVVRLRF